MALTLEQALDLIKSGKAEAMLKEFIVKSAILSHRAEAEGADALTQRAHDLDLLASVALFEAMNTPHGRRALGLKRKPRGKDLDARDYLDQDHVVDIVLRYRRDQISKRQAVQDLDAAVSTAHVRYDVKTIERFLCDLEERIAHNFDLAELLCMWNEHRIPTEDEVERTVRDLYKRRP